MPQTRHQSKLLEMQAMVPHLPPELLDNITSFCDVPTLKMLRLSFRGFLPAANTWLFEEVHLVPIDDSLRKMELISSQPGLSKIVKRFVYHTESIPEYTRTEWLNEVSRKMRGNDCDEHNIEAAYSRYCRFSSQQKDCSIVANHWRGEMTKRLGQALAALTNLQETEITAATSEECMRGQVSPFWRALESKIQVSPIDWFTQSPGHVTQAAWIRAGHFATSILHAILRTWQAPLYRTYKATTVVELYSSREPVYHRLKKIAVDVSIAIRYDYNNYSGYRFRHFEAVTAMLRGCTELEELTLGFVDRKSQHGLSLLHHTHLGQHLWSRLQNLTLRGIRVMEQELLSVIMRHADTLRHLELDKLILTVSERGTCASMKSSWLPVIHRMGVEVSLESLVLRGLRDDMASFGYVGLCGGGKTEDADRWVEDFESAQHIRERNSFVY